MKQHWKLLAFVGVLLVALGAIAVAVVPDSEEPPSLRATPTVRGSFAEAPTVAWTLDVRRLGTVDTDVLLSLPSTLSSYYGYGSVASAGSALIAAVGTPDADNPNHVSDVTLVGVDPENGTALWRARIGEVDQCAYPTDDSPLACWSKNRVVFIDVHNGTLLGDIGTDFDIASAVVDGDTVYVGGARQEAGAPDDVQTPVATRGTVTDIDVSYRREYPDRGPFAAAYVSPRSSSVIVNTPNDAQNNGRYLVVDSESGEPRFDFVGESLQTVSDALFLTSDGSRSGDVGTQNLVDDKGSVVRAIPVPTYPVFDYPGRTDELPLFVGDGAYDRITGDELWRNPAMVRVDSSGRNSAVSAVVGDAVIVRSPDAKTLTALDLYDGEQRWQIPWEDAYWIRDGASDGDNFVFTDYQGMHAIRALDGAALWSVPLPPDADPRVLRVTPAAERLSTSWANQFVMWKTISANESLPR
jgi:outer membrane protein assembly factor BamB